jgi:taurine--2-oxoglutarate transaminase
MGALTLTGDWRRAPFEPGIPGVVHVQDCYCDRCPFGQRVETCARECATNIGATMQLEGAGGTAAVILEPVPGANGVLVPPPEYWPIVRRACDGDVAGSPRDGSGAEGRRGSIEGALLIADEVLTGYGRTGTAFGFQHWDVVPDLITVAKGLASGYATIGAVLVHERVARHFDANVLACGLTYYAHPTACAAALETLRLYDDEGSFANAAALGPVLRAELDAIAARLPGVKTFVRGLGLLAVLEVEAPPAAWAHLNKELAARKLSLHVDGKRGTAIIAPPLCITHDELVRGVRAFGDAAVTAFGATS